MKPQVKYALILLKSLYMVRKKNQNVYCGDQLDEQLSGIPETICQKYHHAALWQ